MMPATVSSALALDVGERRIGVAIASLIARLPRPLTTLENNNEFWDSLRQIISEEGAGVIVVGLPRGLQSQDTKQTESVRTFAAELQSRIELPVFFQDEALTSVQAEKELAAQGKPLAKSAVDALAATYILEDFLQEHQELKL